MPASDTVLLLVSTAIVSAVAVRVVRSIALRRALLDVPNARSSHKTPVPRLGGAAYIPIVLLASLFGSAGSTIPQLVQVAFFAGAFLLFGVSLLDDFRPLPTTIRFAVQFSAAFGILAALAVLDSSSPGWSVASRASSASSLSDFAWFLGPFVLWSVCALWIVGLLNIYNFMDGIDGIAGVQAVVAGAAWWWLGTLAGAPWAALLGACSAAGALGFLTLNWPPAKIFMGDAGSTVLGYILAVLPLLVVVEVGGSAPIERFLVAAVLVVWPFLADGTFTILRRLRKRENIFKAHRSHLYQRLVIAGESHRRVTCVYGVLAVIGAVLAWRVASAAPHAIVTSAAVVVLAFLGLWGWTLRVENRALHVAMG